MGTSTIIAKTASNTPCGQSSVNYTTAHDAGAGAFWYGLNTVGQASYIAGGTSYWEVYRDCLLFDTSSLPDNATITAVTLSLYCEFDQSGTDFDIVVVSGADINDPPVLADYGDLLDDTVSRGSINTSSIVANAYNDITLNATGISEISLTGVTKFGLRSSRDISSTSPGVPPPTHSEYVEFSLSSTPNQEPKLVITYTTPTLGYVQAFIIG